ncbi:MAG: coenzyme F420-0:L-glutamate ligase [Gammaproteobacteria bacterium]|nr:coenzyme F420-0:L-glutamate ligase [Gammaproteobacteria bacterium]MYC25019.1 coenzyme F420-0:L-glutamate ligase [Gammaproteobacteria bacterium]
MNVQILPLRGVPIIRGGEDLGSVLIKALQYSEVSLRDHDVVVIAQKIVSKAENRMVALDSVTPSARALQLAIDVDKDPRLVELILRESIGIVRQKKGVLITRHRLGFVAANSGIDQSNVDHSDREHALLLPLAPDRSAQEIRATLIDSTNTDIGVIISDSVNRPWRLGSVGIAIGVSHTAVLDDRRGNADLFGRKLKITVSNRADSIATAALLVMGETDECIPVAVVRGLSSLDSPDGAHRGNRPIEEDLFQ